MSAPLNLAVVCGRLSSDPRSRDLPSGSTVLNLEITVDHQNRRSDSVPVAFFDPPASAGSFVEGDHIVVIGSVRRRFFRAGGTTASRTELVASRVVKASRSAGVDKMLDRALEEILAARPA